MALGDVPGQRVIVDRITAAVALAFHNLLTLTVFALLAGFQLTGINIGNTGNHNHPDLEVRVVLVTCISNIGYFKARNQPIMQKW